MLQRGELVPHFDVRTFDGALVTYSTSIWQRRNLVLVVVDDRDSDAVGYAQALSAHATELPGLCAALVVTADRIAGLEPPAVVVADRWGEVVYSHHAVGPRDLPPMGELIEWLTYLEHQCPECQGEAR